MSEKKSEKKSHKSPTTRVLTIPAQFLPLIQKEWDRRGCFSQHETMGQILSEYFGTDGKKKPQDNPDEVLKGVKLDA
ncbi:hypothetical protein ES705_15951 [subsurface metagenome]